MAGGSSCFRKEQEETDYQAWSTFSGSVEEVLTHCHVKKNGLSGGIS